MVIPIFNAVHLDYGCCHDLISVSMFFVQFSKQVYPSSCSCAADATGAFGNHVPGWSTADYRTALPVHLQHDGAVRAAGLCSSVEAEGISDGQLQHLRGQVWVVQQLNTHTQRVEKTRNMGRRPCKRLRGGEHTSRRVGKVFAGCGQIGGQPSKRMAFIRRSVVTSGERAIPGSGSPV